MTRAANQPIALLRGVREVLKLLCASKQVLNGDVGLEKGLGSMLAG
jgi:hypothetical protein